MTKFDEVKKALLLESELPPAKRRTQVPCAFCTRGGNGDKSCGCGWQCTRYSKYQACFNGTLLPEAPK